MRTCFAIFLLTVGCMGESNGSTAEAPTSIVRAQRLRTFLVDDYHLIMGSSGDVDSGGDAATRGYADEEFKDPTFVTYRRIPTSIVIAESGKRIAETGRFEGIWRKPDGTMRRTGVYLAMWIPYGGTWRLKSEAFVTLACTGSVTCDKTG